MHQRANEPSRRSTVGLCLAPQGKGGGWCVFQHGRLVPFFSYVIAIFISEIIDKKGSTKRPAVVAANTSQTGTAASIPP
jgi:hypothetical protein